MPIRSLTKENFWNELSDKCPGEMKRFKEWIDEYKKQVVWEYVFCNGFVCIQYETPEGRGMIHTSMRDLKYHDLPIAMQVGIFIQYTLEVPHTTRFVAFPVAMDDFAEVIRIWFMTEEYYNTVRGEDGKQNLSVPNHPDNFKLN